MMMIRLVLSLGLILCVGAGPCPGGTQVCPEGSTCCKLPDQEYGCCPMEDAVCCRDHVHCCPHGYVCDTGRCSQPFYNMTQQQVLQEKDVVCPGGYLTCPSDSTCCKNNDGVVVGCCIEPDAVCCPGGEYCCPNGTSCDTKKGQCNDRSGLDLKMKRAQKPHHNVVDTGMNSLLSRYTSVICPDGESSCPDQFTCCELPQGMWGCCPFPEANCCSDHLHCCPSEMSCSPSSTSCERSGFNMTSFETLASINLNSLK